MIYPIDNINFTKLSSKGMEELKNEYEHSHNARSTLSGVI
jgi:hypothetical protein